jgi:hypothetical protein
MAAYSPRLEAFGAPVCQISDSCGSLFAHVAESGIPTSGTSKPERNGAGAHQTPVNLLKLGET